MQLRLVLCKIPTALPSFLALTALAAMSPAASAQTSSTTTTSETMPDKKADDVVSMSAFTVSETNDKGYYSENTMIGSRTAENVMQIPSGVSIINQEMITDLGAPTLQSALNYGSSGVKQNQALADDFQIRGFRTNGILRDGIETPSFTRSPMYDVERIEVLKGPAAMLLGENNFLGGAVNVITQQPTEQFHGRANLEFSNENYLKYDVNAGGPVVNNENLKVLYHVTIGGWNDDRFKEIENRYERFYAGAVKFIIGKNTSITVQFHDFTNDSYQYFDDVSDSTYPNGRTVPAPYTGFDFSIASSKDVFWKVREKFTRAEFLQSFTPNSSLRLVYAVEDQTDRRRLIRQNGPVVNFMLPRSDLPFEATTDVHTLQADYVYKSDFGFLKNEISAGGQSDVTQGYQRLSVFTELPAIDIRHPDFSKDVLVGFNSYASPTGFSSNTFTKTTQNHYYVQDQIKVFSDKLTLVGGVRWIERNRDAINVNTNIDTVTNAPRVAVHKVGIVYQPIPAISFYATQAANVFAAVGGDLNPGTPYETTRLDQDGKLKEVGGKFNALNGALYGSVAYFDMAMTNVVVGGNAPDGSKDALGNPIQINTQQAEQTSKGYEVEVGYRQQVAAIGHADLLGTYYAAKSFDETGHRFYNSVPWEWSLLAKFSVTTGPIKGFTIGAGVHDQGPIVEIVNVTTNYWPMTGDAFASYEFLKHWRVSLNVDNITNKYYIITGGSLSQGSDPRRFRTGVSYSW